MTAKINAYFKPKMTPRQRYDAYDKAQKELIAAGEKAGKDLRCTLAAMYSGNAYCLYTFKQIRDVRLVYAPPQDLGNYGGETDNWMWPRHTCDFSFLRAYVAPDGTAADYSPSNVPYKPKVWLKVSLDGFREGDFTFVMGYPGRTYRNYALPELKADQENMAKRIKDIQDVIRFYEDAGKSDKEVEIRYAGQVKGLYNGLKNMQGKLEGFEKYDLVAKKAVQEKELKDVPVCFLNTTNVTGGNSGSPTFNARGEQIGIIFDMTYESVIGDYYIIPELQRSISVDVRYVLWITDKFSGATHIVKEMGLAAK